MAGCVMKSACRLVMRNHYYSYNNSIRKQSRGGAIGNKITEKLGRLLMKRHDKKYHGLLRKLKIEEELSERYVDDELEVLTATEPGVRFEEGKLFKDETKVEEDKKIPDDGHTFHLSPQQKDENVHNGGGGCKEAKEWCPRAGMGEEQGCDGTMEQEAEKERISGNHET